MVFRKRGGGLAPEKQWRYTGEEIEYVNKYKYLTLSL